MNILKITVLLCILGWAPVNGQEDSLKTRDDAKPYPTKNLTYHTDNPTQSRLDSLVDQLVRGYMQSPENCGLSIGISVKGHDYFYNYGEKNGIQDPPSMKTPFMRSARSAQPFADCCWHRQLPTKK